MSIVDRLAAGASRVLTRVADSPVAASAAQHSELAKSFRSSYQTRSGGVVPAQEGASNILIAMTYAHPPKSVTHIENMLRERGNNVAVTGVRNLSVDTAGQVIDRSGQPVVGWDAVIARGGATHTEDDMRVLHAFEQNGIPVINPPDVIKLAGNKWLTAQRLRELGVPHPATAPVFAGSSVEDIERSVRSGLADLGERGQHGLVLKPASDKGGKGVTFLDTSDPTIITGVANQLLHRGSGAEEVLVQGSSGRMASISAAADDGAGRASQVRNVLSTLKGEDLTLIARRGIQTTHVPLGQPSEVSLRSVADLLLDGGRPADTLVMQQWAKAGTGHDVRVFVGTGADGKAHVTGAIERIAGEGQGTANISKGGSSTAYKLSPEQEAQAIKTAEGIRLTGAVDQIRASDGTGWQIVEINSSPGTTRVIDEKAGGSLAENLSQTVEDIAASNRTA